MARKGSPAFQGATMQPTAADMKPVFSVIAILLAGLLVAVKFFGKKKPLPKSRALAGQMKRLKAVRQAKPKTKPVGRA